MLPLQLIRSKYQVHRSSVSFLWYKSIWSDLVSPSLFFFDRLTRIETKTKVINGTDAIRTGFTISESAMTSVTDHAARLCPVQVVLRTPCPYVRWVKSQRRLDYNADRELVSIYWINMGFQLFRRKASEGN